MATGCKRSSGPENIFLAEESGPLKGKAPGSSLSPLAFLASGGERTKPAKENPEALIGGAAGVSANI